MGVVSTAASVATAVAATGPGLYGNELAASLAVDVAAFMALVLDGQKHGPGAYAVALAAVVAEPYVLHAAVHGCRSSRAHS